VKTYVLDASALVSFMTDSAGAGRVQQLFEEAHRGHVSLLASVVNVGEVFYKAWQTQGEQHARDVMALVSHLPFGMIPVDLEQSLKAGEIKARHKLPYVDCIAASLSMVRGATLVTSDDDFGKLGRHFPILWLTRR